MAVPRARTALPDVFRTPRRRALLVLWLLISLYVLNFTILSLLQHAAFETGAADMGNMNQAAWYTLHHGNPTDTFDGRPITRFGGHVEPIWYLLILPYALHQSATTLLIVQTVIIALGALPAFWLARDTLASEGAGLAFALAYLFFPALQAANLTEFHPLALVATFLLFAFHYLQKGKVAPFIIFALLAMSTKEDMALIAAMLGLFAVVTARLPAVRRAGLLVFAAGVVWFLISVYVIIPHFSRSGDVVLFQRYAEVGGSPQGLVRTLFIQPTTVLAPLLAANKLSYLAGLLASTAFLSLGAPWALVLAAPSLGINMLSNYPPMYSGLSHYSVPIVAFVVIGAIYGARFVTGLLQHRFHLSSRRSLLLVCLWLLVGVLAYQTQTGFTPLSLRYRIPQVTAHHRLIARFLSQIPADAAVSAQGPLHPHVSSRAVVYPFPIINDAQYVLLDVTARPTMHPNDLKDAFHRLTTQEGFGILDAADGYILLHKGTPSTILPESFYTAFRSDQPKPQRRVVIDFDPYLRLLGYDITDVDEGRQPWTTARFYWQVKAAPPIALRIYPFYTDEQGTVIEDTSQRPLVATLWHPPERWRVGEVVMVQTLPWPLGDAFRLAVGVVRGPDWANRSARIRPRLVETTVPLRPLDGQTAVELGSFRRRITALVTATASPARPSRRLEADLGGQVKLLGYDLQPATPAAGAELTLTLYWQAIAPSLPEYHTFVHLYDQGGELAAQSDGLTGNDQPTPWWLPGQVVTETRTLTIPLTHPRPLAAGLAVGLYRLDSDARLPVVGRGGAPQGDLVAVPLPRW